MIMLQLLFVYSSFDIILSSMDCQINVLFILKLIIISGKLLLLGHGLKDAVIFAASSG
jgi:hypothetical protein